MELQTPDLTFYFAIHEAQREAIGRYLAAVRGLAEAEREDRGTALARWAKGFSLELDEHHYVEDRFFFPSLRAKVSTAGPVLDRLEADHRRLDLLLARWKGDAAALADPSTPFERASERVQALAHDLCDLLRGHLAVEDTEVLPLFSQHYSADEYQVVFDQAVKKGKKAGLWFVAPFSVDCYPEGPERDAFLASVPAVLRLLHRIVRPRYDRLVASALGSESPVSLSARDREPLT
jgi:hypothetical protein